MISASLILWILAFVFFVLAGLNVTANGKIRFEWLAAACIVGAVIVGGVK